MHGRGPEALLELAKTGEIDVGAVIDEIEAAKAQKITMELKVAEPPNGGIRLPLEAGGEAGSDLPAEGKRDEPLAGVHDLPASKSDGIVPASSTMRLDVRTPPAVP